jgi:biotin carboxyl carrier protein
MIYDVEVDGNTHRLELAKNDGRWQCRLDGRDLQVDAVLTRPEVLSLLIDGKSYEIKRERGASDLHLWVGSARFRVELRDPRSLQGRKDRAGDAKGPKRLLAPMAGRVIRVLVSETDSVEAGQGLVVVEAMKMQNEIKSPKTGVVQKVLASEGANVNAGDVLVIVE